MYYRYEHNWPPQGWVKSIDPDSLLMTETGSPASGTKRFRDYGYNDTGTGSRVSAVGGYAANGPYGGLGARHVGYALGRATSSVGCRPSA